MKLMASDQFRIVMGLGQTGISCVRYLAKKHARFAVVDSRSNPPDLAAFKTEFPRVELRLGKFDAHFLARATELIISPGVAQTEPAIQEAIGKGVRLSGDIDLFCREITAPIIAITGSNAKSTVTTLVGKMAQAAGINVGVCGNIGTPVLQMLEEPEKELYVIELSSFQLETTQALRAKVAAVLNITPDHMDRYSSFQAYHKAKHRIFRGAKNVVVNKDDPLTMPLVPSHVISLAYHTGAPDINVYGLIKEKNDVWISLGTERLLPASELKIKGHHNLMNAMAALAIGQLAGLHIPVMLKALKEFPGLKHRCQWVGSKAGVTYINDSKGTNVGATLAAIIGLGETLNEDNRLILIAGGQGKKADFSKLSTPLKRYGRGLIYMGEDGKKIADTCKGINKQAVDNMQEAVVEAAAMAMEGDIVLLSPACASFDMFGGFAERGEAFVEVVEAL